MKNPYQVKGLWEFPLQIMDGYILRNGFEQAVESTREALQEARSREMPFFSLLFHDYTFNEKTYPVPKRYYEWFVEYCAAQHYPFISYKDAIHELDTVKNRRGDRI